MNKKNKEEKSNIEIDYNVNSIFQKNNLENELDTFTNLQTRNVTDDESNSSTNSNSNSNSNSISSNSDENNKIDKIINLKHKKSKSNTEFIDNNKINNSKFSELYNILINTQMIIFVDDYKLTRVKKCNFCKYFVKKNLVDENFPGCIFFPFEYKQTLLRCLNSINQKIIKSELNRSDLKNKSNEKYYCICFDEGEISKNVIYKKLEIRNKLLFIPIEKFKLKLTEYRIRGFCQIMEELGARSIDIYFSNKNKNINCNSISSNTNLGTLIGNLGFSLSRENQDNENRKYRLTYPSFNTINLNENHIRKKIKKKEFIISENKYNYDLELQYIISSRCRHFITNYSTSFTLDTSSSIDKKLSIKLQRHKIGSALKYSKTKYNNNQIIIKTDVIFSDEITIKDNLLGSCVSFDYIGFNFLMNSLRKENFKEKGIYKIMDFIEYYSSRYLKKLNNKSRYNKINNILIKIKNNFTMNEYAEMLLNYFNINSEWKHFKYFIDLLSYNTISYDKLGYLILIENQNLDKSQKITNLINYIHENCIIRDKKDPSLKLEFKFWKMLNPIDKKLKYLFIEKIENEYNLLGEFNWFGLNKLINDIKNYRLIKKEDTNEIIFDKLYKNIILGYKYYEFYVNMLPFVKKTCGLLHFKSSNKESNNLTLEDKVNTNNDKQYFNFSLLNSINYESFMTNGINNYFKLEEYLKIKLCKLYLADDLINEFLNLINDCKSSNLSEKRSDIRLIENIYKFIAKNEKFKKKYRYYYKKIKIIFENYELDSDIMRTKIFSYYMISDIKISCEKDRIKSFVNRIFCYNEKLKIYNIPINYLGFQLVYNRIKNGDKDIEYEKTVLIFTKRMMKRIINLLYDPNNTKLKKSILFIEKFTELLDFNNYYEFVMIILDILKKKNKLENINQEIIKSILES